MHGPTWARDEVDVTSPSVARVYDHLLGGSHNFAADRAFARTVVATYPLAPAVARENRGFLRRVVQHLATIEVDQFLDLGSGLPTAGSVHEVVRAVRPAARVVYVDHDPVVIALSRRLLSGAPGTHVLAADLLDPERVLAAAVAEGGLDLRRPVAVLAVSVLHFVPDERRPATTMASYLGAVVPGSHLAISHTRVPAEPEALAAQQLYAHHRSLRPVRSRSAAEIATLFGDLTLLAPGLVAVPAWRPEPTEDPTDDPAEAEPVREGHPMLAGVGRRD